MSLATTAARRHGRAQTTVDTRLGPVLLACSDTGLLGLWFAGQKHHPGALAVPEDAADPLLQRATAQLGAYLDGGHERFDVPLDLHGTAFERAVWELLLGIGRGTTTSYGEIARRLGSASAVRAVGGAIGRNPVSVIVPCHRVVGRDGALTGYAGGTERKHALLVLEGARLV